MVVFFFFFKQKTAYEITTGDWSSDVCSSDLGQQRRMGNPAYDGRFVFTRIRYTGPSFGGSRWSHDYPAADFYISDALDTLTRMRVNEASTNVLELEDPRIFDNPILYISEPGYWRISDKGAANLRMHLLKGGLVIFDDFEHQDE